MGFLAQETVWICVTNGRKTMNLCCRSNTILVLVLGLSTKESVPGQQPPGRSLQPRSVQGGDFRQPVSPHRKWTRVIIGVTGCKQIHV